jgi:hypothetical protein
LPLVPLAGQRPFPKGLAVGVEIQIQEKQRESCQVFQKRRMFRVEAHFVLGDIGITSRDMRRLVKNRSVVCGIEDRYHGHKKQYQRHY